MMKPTRPKTARQIAAEQEKATRILARETRQNESDDRFTPPELVAAVETGIGKIACDPCWHPESAVRPLHSLDVRKGQNGLRDPWSGRVAFMNPPFSAQDAWLKRAYDQWRCGNVGTVLCLVPNATDTRFFQKVVKDEADVYFLAGRPRFYKTDKTSQTTMRVLMIVLFGATLTQRKRFERLVEGTWPRPDRPASRRPTKRHAGGPIRRYRKISCAAAKRPVRRVLCGPIADAIASIGR